MYQFERQKVLNRTQKSGTKLAILWFSRTPQGVVSEILSFIKNPQGFYDSVYFTVLGSYWYA